MAEADNIIKLKKGELLYSSGEDVEYVFVILEGSVKAYSPYGIYTLAKDSIACLSGGYYGISIFNYVADEDTTVRKFYFNNIDDLVKVCNSFPDRFGGFVMCYNKFVMEVIRTYLTLFVKCRKKDSAYTFDARISKWELDKFNGMASIPPDISEKYFASNACVAAATMAEGARFITLLNDVCLQMAEFLEINMDYVPVSKEPEHEPVMPISSDEEYMDEEIISGLKNSMAQILDYAEIDDEEKADFISLINSFKSFSDKFSSDDTIRKVRRDICDRFYKIYYLVFNHSLNDDVIPACIKMFLNFGYLDETLISDRNAIILFKTVQNIDEVCNNNHVYTMYSWLKHILWGEKEPSRNHLDQNYEEYIRTEIRSGSLHINEEEALSDNDMKLRFEIENLFKQTHRMTYGKMSAFVPMLVEENIFKPLDSMFISAENVMKSINDIRSIDFSLFFRSTIYSNEKLGIGKEYIYTEVLPDIILTPCIGSYGAMWQEIEGRKRLSSARFVFPIFCSSKFEQLMLITLGKFRWELCKRIQGNYWNNITEKSLTSEYYDYLQFYKKNRDLSEASKEKVKSTLQACRNNYGEVFAKDYEQWISYESKGSGRMNKVSRMIFSKYCPFIKSIRMSLHSNPMYEQAIDAYERQCSVKSKHLDNIIKTLESRGVEIPREIRETKAYYRR